MPALYLALVLAAALLAGCASSPVARHYTLSADATESHRIAADQRKIEIVAVRIPETWDRPQIVMTRSSAEVALSEFHRWAAPLRYEAPRIVTSNLTRILDSRTLWLRRDFVGMQPDLRVQVAIDQIDAAPAEGFQLKAAWLIRSENGVAKSGRTVIAEPLAAATHEAVVTAAGRALLTLSIAIAKDIQTLPQ